MRREELSRVNEEEWGQLRVPRPNDVTYIRTQMQKLDNWMNVSRGMYTNDV